ncbi:MAG: hypothetical protein ACPG31_05440 [Planctomycetota bacterium]
MGKALIFILTAFALSCSGESAPDNVDLKQVIAKLQEEHVVVAFRFDYKMHTDVAELASMDPFSVGFEGTFVQSGDPSVACPLDRHYLFEELSDTFFNKNSNGIRHSLSDPDWGTPAWNCPSVDGERGNLGPLGFFGEGGVHLREQAIGLLRAYPPDRIASRGGEVVMTWETVSASIESTMRTQFPGLIGGRVSMR